MSAIDQRPQSPCINICTLDDDKVCLGCRRTLAEIVAWATLSAAEQIAVLERVKDRWRSAAAIGVGGGGPVE